MIGERRKRVPSADSIEREGKWCFFALVIEPPIPQRERRAIEKLRRVRFRNGIIPCHDDAASRA